MNPLTSSKRHNIFSSTTSSTSHGGDGAESAEPAQLVRTHGGVINVPWKKFMNSNKDHQQRKVTKLLLNVNIQNSVGPVQVVMSPENTVEELIKAVIDVYVKEKRRSLLTSNDPRCFELHYSQFSLESLKRNEILMNLGSRNFFLCQRSSQFYDEVNPVAKLPFPSTTFMDFLL